jgi:hypothetical protein
MTIKNFSDLDFYTGLSGKRFGVVEKQALTGLWMIYIAAMPVEYVNQNVRNKFL